MKIPAYSSGLFCLLALALLTGPEPVRAEHGTVLARIEAAGDPFDNTKIESTHQLTAKTVVAHETYRGGEFRVLARKDFIKRYRCSVCHTDKPKPGRDSLLTTHSDIKLKHGRANASLVCTECHHQKERDFLTDSQGLKIDFDHSYELCGKCHFRQKRDWLGGAHGKRETYWAGERVVRNCTSCHNPHAPAFTTKMPATYSLPLAE